MKRLISSIFLMFCVLLPLSAQSEKKEVRKGNSDYKKENFKESEIHYRKALIQDSTSFAAVYDLANTLYRQRDFEGADNTYKKIEEVAPESPHASKYYFNKGNVDLQKQDYEAAVEDFKQSLLRNPSDLQAKESYIYAKKMLEKQGQGGDQGENKEQNQDQKQQNDQKQRDEQNQSQQNEENKDSQSEAQGQQISAQQAQQMLKAIQAKEKETQEKVEKMKAEKAKTRQKDKNW